MSPEERQLLTQLFDRVRQASSTPRDREAESLIEGELRSQPYATYYLAQAVIIQEKGLEAATAKIRDLEDQIAHLQDELSRGPAQPPAQQQSGGFLGGISSILEAAVRRLRHPATQGLGVRHQRRTVAMTITAAAPRHNPALGEACLQAANGSNRDNNQQQLQQAAAFCAVP